MRRTAILGGVWVCATYPTLAAHDPRCEAPPYGASQQAYDVIMREPGPLQGSGELLASICAMKYGGADRSPLYRLGFTDEDIRKTSPAILLIEEAGAIRSLARPARKASSNSPPPADYESITIHDFAVDGPKLVSQKSRIQVFGQYIRHGNVDILYANQQALLTDTQPTLALLTDGASHKLRERMVNCQSNPAESQLGCTLTVRGIAITCVLTNAFGVAQNVPCINAEDGG